MNSLDFIAAERVRTALLCGAGNFGQEAPSPVIG